MAGIYSRIKFLGERHIDKKHAWPSITQVYPKLPFKSMMKIARELHAKPASICENVLVKPIHVLTKEQEDYLEFVKSICSNSAREQFLSIVHSQAGCGKSYLLSKITEFFSQKNIHYAITAPTGVSAFNVGATTVHYMFGLGHKTDYEREHDAAPSPKVRGRLAGIQFLIVDEMSLVSAKMLALIDKRLRDVLNSNVDFGGISVILFGDIFQLSCIASTELWHEPSQITKPNDWMIKKGLDLYRKFSKVKVLETVLRQQHDHEFQQLLHNFRYKTLKERHVALLEGRMKSNLSDEEIFGFDKAIHIFPKNGDVDRHNRKVISALNIPVVAVATFDDEILTSGRKTYLAPGLRVMLRKNLSVSLGLVNGSLGTIKHVLVDDGEKEGEISLITVEFPSFIGTALPDNSIPIFPTYISKYDPVKGRKVQTSVFPISNAYAITAHKSQSATLTQSALKFDDQEICYGISYVALSRVKKLKDVLILDENFEHNRFTCENFLKGVEERVAEEQRLKSISNSCWL